MQTGLGPVWPRSLGCRRSQVRSRAVGVTRDPIGDTHAPDLQQGTGGVPSARPLASSCRVRKRIDREANGEALWEDCRADRRKA